MIDSLKSSSQRSLNTPVLFLVFNRLESTKKVFETIRLVKPPRLYIASDGARVEVEGELDKVLAIRNYLFENIDWDCNVKTLYRDKNFGCKYAVSNAISWFFNQEKEGIILEDDCLPSQSFFWFCEDLLDKFRYEMKIGQISGDNFQQGFIRGDDDYYFSIYNHIWGWASWSSRWELYDVNLKTINDASFLDKLPFDNSVKKYWKNIYLQTKSGNIDTWDYQWTFCLWNNEMLTVLPNYNLVSNIGFGSDATHTNSISRFSELPSFDFVLKNHPINISINISADRFTESTWGMNRSMISAFKTLIFNVLVYFKIK